jgi:2-methylcitrate dehydratase PrpD
MARNSTVKADPNAPGITEMLARFVTGHPSRGWSDAVEREAHRTFANWVGCAIGPSRHETMQAALAAVQMLSPAPQASVLGRREKVDIASAALLNGISSHTFDFDDTHLKTIIHPAGPVAPAALALAEHLGLGGRALIDALVLGIEVSCRVGNAIYPDHYDRGWHITGSTGMLGSAAACSRLLGLDAGRTQMALGIAASQPIGVREQFGTMTKPFHPGGAARVGLMSALMARHGYTASKRALEAPRGLLQVFSDKTDWSEITEGLGQHWEISLNTYKPFACGIVIHPSIDACVQLREKHHLTAADIAKVTIRVHSLVLERQEGADDRTGEQVQRLPLVRGRPAVRPGRRTRVHRRGRQPPRGHGAAREGRGRRRRPHRRGLGRHHDPHHRRP